MTMARATFQQRLARCVERGNLTVADLERWFGRPYATVRSWLVDGWEPGDGPVTRRAALVSLERLERVVSRNAGELQALPMRRRAERLIELGGSRQ